MKYLNFFNMLVYSLFLPTILIKSSSAEEENFIVLKEGPSPAHLTPVGITNDIDAWFDRTKAPSGKIAWMIAKPSFQGKRWICLTEEIPKKIEAEYGEFSLMVPLKDRNYYLFVYQEKRSMGLVGLGNTAKSNQIIEFK